MKNRAMSSKTCHSWKSAKYEIVMELIVTATSVGISVRRVCNVFIQPLSVVIGGNFVTRGRHDFRMGASVLP